MTAKGFASANDTEEKNISFDEIGRGLYAFTAEGDPNSGVIVGDDSVMVVDAQATPVMALEVIKRVRAVTDKPIKHVLLTHYHAVRVLGASAYQDAEILASDVTRGQIVERGRQDMEFGDRPLPAAVPRGGIDPRPDLADHHLPRSVLDLARPARGPHHAHRAWSHRRRWWRLPTLDFASQLR